MRVSYSSCDRSRVTSRPMTSSCILSSRRWPWAFSRWAWMKSLGVTYVGRKWPAPLLVTVITTCMGVPGVDDGVSGVMAADRGHHAGDAVGVVDATPEMAPLRHVAVLTLYSLCGIRTLAPFLIG